MGRRDVFFVFFAADCEIKRHLAHSSGTSNLEVTSAPLEGNSTEACRLGGTYAVSAVRVLNRGDCCWGTLNHFWVAAEKAGLEGDPTPVDELKTRAGEGRHNDSERLLLTLTKRASV